MPSTETFNIWLARKCKTKLQITKKVKLITNPINYNLYAYIYYRVVENTRFFAPSKVAGGVG